MKPKSLPELKEELAGYEATGYEPPVAAELRAIIADREETHVEEMVGMLIRLRPVVDSAAEHSLSAKESPLYKEYMELLAKLEGER